MITDVPDGNAFTKIGFDAVDTHAQDRTKFLAVPCPRFRVCHIKDAHACLPEIGLPDAAVVHGNQESLFHAFFKQIGLLTDIGIDPAAEVKTFFMVTAKHSFRIRESLWIPDEITPVISSHPVTVKMEDGQRNAAFCHTIDERGRCRLIVIGRKGR